MGEPVSTRIDERTIELQKGSSAKIMKTYVDPKDDIHRERARASFKSAELDLYLVGGEKELQLRQRCVEVLKTDPAFSKSDRYFLTREQLYERTLTHQFRIGKKAMEMGEANPLAAGKLLREMVDEPGGLDLHIGMFIPTIQGQGDAEQQKYWLPLCYSTKIIGTYAQTELGHGTFLRGLETTATYDPRTQEFIIHSPTITATKWWPGGLGKTASHALVMARLFTQGKDLGPHAFIVHLRSPEDHSPLPGVIVGDIGNKMGYNAVDNGFVRFDHVRVPRRNMLMKHSKVDPDGTFHPPPVAKAAYGTMVFVRADIVSNAALFLKKGLTIAIRYNAVRRQSNIKPDGLETQVLDYQHSQRTLFPLLATAYAFHFTGAVMRRMYFQFEKASRTGGDFSALPELHATSSGLKAYCTWKTKDGLEISRLACGGHGFMHISGIPHTAGNYAPQATYEGDNNVLCLQTARYLLKANRLAAKGEKPAGNAFYLALPVCARSKIGQGGKSVRDLEACVDAFEHRAARLVKDATAKMAGLKDDVGFQVLMVDWIKAAKAHCAYVVLRNFTQGVEEAPATCSPPTCVVLQRLLALHALSGIEDEIGDFLEDGYLMQSQTALVHKEVQVLLKEIRPDAVALVDAFGLDDYFLNSALGAHDGDVYRRAYDWVQSAPMNHADQGPGYSKLLQPRLSRFQPPDGEASESQLMISPHIESKM